MLWLFVLVVINYLFIDEAVKTLKTIFVVYKAYKEEKKSNVDFRVCSEEFRQIIQDAVEAVEVVTARARDGKGSRDVPGQR